MTSQKRELKCRIKYLLLIRLSIYTEIEVAESAMWSVFDGKKQVQAARQLNEFMRTAKIVKK